MIRRYPSPPTLRLVPIRTRLELRVCCQPPAACGRNIPMTLLRFAARTMLASYFVSSGVNALRDPAALAPVAEPLIDRVVPVLKQYAPDQVSDSIPDDPVTVVRINGVLQLVGGLAL